MNYKLHSNTHDDLTAYYGLPKEVKFCKNCVISNQRPNSCVEHENKKDSLKSTIELNLEGICSACVFSIKKQQTINWQEREAELIELCNKFRKNNGQYDCLIPGSGGKDSFYAAHQLKYKYGMNPLTVTWAPAMYTSWGWQNFQSWIHSGFDNYLCTPNGKVHRLLTRLAVENLFHPFQPFILGQKFIAPKLAAMMDIPLIFYGENEAEYGNPIKDTETSLRDSSYFTNDEREKIFLGGVPVKDLKSEFGLSDMDLNFYLPSSRKLVSEKKIEVHYLGYYLKWHPQAIYYYAVENSDFKASPERSAGTYTKYVSIDDKIDDLHFYTTYIKFGIGRASYESAHETRTGEITREEAVALVKKYDGEFPERFINEILDYLSIPEKDFPVASKKFKSPIMTREYFDELTDSFRSPHLWTRVNDNWKLRKTVFDESH
jgi:N-acetyl sugar amidotransferase